MFILLDMRKIYRREVIIFDKNFQFLSKITTSLQKIPSRTLFERSEKQGVERHVSSMINVVGLDRQKKNSAQATSDSYTTFMLPPGLEPSYTVSKSVTLRGLSAQSEIKPTIP